MSDHKELLKHSRNYLFANIATKALAFISIPVYTRLLSVEDYGIVNVYISVIMIAPILMTLNTEVTIARYYFDSKDIDDFNSIYKFLEPYIKEDGTFDLESWKNYFNTDSLKAGKYSCDF